MVWKMNAQKAYQDWKKQFKINMAVYSDEQMFIMGYESRNQEVDELIGLLESLNSQLQKAKKTKVKKDE